MYPHLDAIYDASLKNVREFYGSQVALDELRPRLPRWAVMPKLRVHDREHGWQEFQIETARCS